MRLSAGTVLFCYLQMLIHLWVHGESAHVPHQHESSHEKAEAVRAGHLHSKPHHEGGHDHHHFLPRAEECHKRHGPGGDEEHHTHLHPGIMTRTVSKDEIKLAAPVSGVPGHLEIAARLSARSQVQYSNPFYTIHSPPYLSNRSLRL